MVSIEGFLRLKVITCNLILIAEIVGKIVKMGFI